MAPLRLCSLQLSCCCGGRGGREEEAAVEDRLQAGSPCLPPPHKHGELGKVMTEADNSKTQALGLAFSWQSTTAFEESRGGMHFVEVPLIFLDRLSVQQDAGLAGSGLGTPALSFQEVRFLFFSKTVAG